MKAASIFAVLLFASTARAINPAVTQADIDEHLGGKVPLDLHFTDEHGRAVTLADELEPGKPTVLVLAYYQCPMLCDLVLRGIGNAIARQSLELGRDFAAVTVSFDPRDKPPEASLKQHQLMQALGRDPRDEQAWPFLVSDENQVKQLADALGFRYGWDPRTKQYAHPAVAFVLTPDGRISRYLYGVSFRPVDVRLALDEASSGKIGTIVDRVLLTCFHYDPATRRYGFVVTGVLKGGAALVLLLVGGGLALLWRRDFAGTADERERRRRGA